MTNEEASAEFGALSESRVDAIESVVRDLIRHENELVHQRLSWLIQSQGLLFAALAFCWKPEPRLVYVLAILGVATSLSMWTAIQDYSPAVRGLREWWEANVPESHKKGRLVIGRWSPSKGIKKYLRPWRALPAIFVFAWGAVLVIRLLQIGK